MNLNEVTIRNAFLPGDGCGVVALLMKRGVHQVSALLCVVGNRGDGCHHHRHAEGNRREQLDDMVGPILEAQLLLLLHQLLFLLLSP